LSTLAAWPDEIHLIGVGGIGTHVLQILSELGAKTVHIWDDDQVEAHNLKTQPLYRKIDIGTYKVDAAVRYAERQDWDMEVIPHREFVDVKTSELFGIVISAVHDTPGRREIWQAVQKNRAFIPVYMDGRIINEFAQLLTVDPCDPTQTDPYLSSLIDIPQGVIDRTCTTRENPHSAYRVASMVSMNLTLFLQDQPVKVSMFENLRREAISDQHQLAVHK